MNKATSASARRAAPMRRRSRSPRRAGIGIGYRLRHRYTLYPILYIVCTLYYVLDLYCMLCALYTLYSVHYFRYPMLYIVLGPHTIRCRPPEDNHLLAQNNSAQSLTPSQVGSAGR